MFENIVTELRDVLIEDEAGHHAATAKAMEKSKHAHGYHDDMERRAGKSEHSHLAVHHDAMAAADKHADSEIALLKAAKDQHLVGNQELAGHLFGKAREHRHKRHDALGAAMVAHGFHRLETHGTEDEGLHPQGRGDETVHQGKAASDEADSVGPHEMGHADRHERAAAAHKEGKKSAENDMKASYEMGAPSAAEYYQMLSRVHAHHIKVHKAKSKI